MLTNCLRHVRTVWQPLAVVGLVLGLAAPTARAYNLNNSQWYEGPINLTIALGPVGRTLSDGSTSWDAVAQRAVSEWNGNLGLLQFAATVDDGASPAQGDQKNTVAFSDTIYGDVFGDETIAVTLLSYDSTTGYIDEGDVLVNRQFGFDSYDGPLHDPGTSKNIDLHRVLLHEFGHVLGLLHPDSIGQNVSAVMNSVISDTDSLTTDDTTGTTAIYGDPALRRVNINPYYFDVESGRGLIYSTTLKANGKGHLKAIDPYLNQITASVPTGLKPGILSESEGGEHLYLGIDGMGVVDQIDPDTLKTTLEFPLGAQSGVTAGDIEALPGAPDSVLVSQKGNAAGAAQHHGSVESADFAVYDAGVLRPEEEFDPSTTPGSPVNFNEKGGTFYAYLRTFYNLGAGSASRLTLEPGGVSSQVQAGVVNTGNLTGGAWFRQGTVYGSDGSVTDLDQGVYEAPFADVQAAGGASTVTVDAGYNQAYFAVPSPGTTTADHKPTLLVEKLTDRSHLGNIALPRYAELYVVERWGTNGLVLGLDGGRMLLLRSTLIAPGSVTDLPQVVTLGAPNRALIDEGNTRKSKLVVTRTDSDLSSPLTVHYSVTGTAQNGTDYGALSGVVTIPAGEATALIKVIPLGSHFSDGPRTVQIRLSPELLYRWGTSITATVTLTDG